MRAMSGERCEKCDREGCDRAAAEAELQEIRISTAGAPRHVWIEKSQGALGRIRRSGCKPVDWRQRALAAEERVAQAEALLREAADVVSTAMVERIDAWLAGTGKETP